MSWGNTRRPRTGIRTSAPSPREGVDGDMQVLQTPLGAKLFGKLGGAWHDVPLSINGVTRIGTTLANHLSITHKGIEIYENNSKVASFGKTMHVSQAANFAGALTIDTNASGGTLEAKGVSITGGTGGADYSGLTITGNHSHINIGRRFLGKHYI